MYNRYLSAAQPEPPGPPQGGGGQPPFGPPQGGGGQSPFGPPQGGGGQPPGEPPQENRNQEHQRGGLLGGLSSLFGNLKKPQLTLENIVVIAVIYFLISDSEELDTDLLIIVAILLFIGI